MIKSGEIRTFFPNEVSSAILFVFTASLTELSVVRTVKAPFFPPRMENIPPVVAGRAPRRLFRHED